VLDARAIGHEDVVVRDFEVALAVVRRRTHQRAYQPDHGINRRTVSAHTREPVVVDPHLQRMIGSTIGRRPAVVDATPGESADVIPAGFGTEARERDPPMVEVVRIRLDLVVQYLDALDEIALGNDGPDHDVVRDRDVAHPLVVGARPHHDPDALLTLELEATLGLVAGLDAVVIDQDVANARIRVARGIRDDQDSHVPVASERGIPHGDVLDDSVLITRIDVHPVGLAETRGIDVGIHVVDQHRFAAIDRDRHFVHAAKARITDHHPATDRVDVDSLIAHGVDQNALDDDLAPGLHDRDAMKETFGYEVARSNRSQQSFSIVLTKVDDFSGICERHGDRCGDWVLITIANLLRRILRQPDHSSRWANEEFMLILPDTDSQGGGIAAERIRIEVDRSAYLFDGEQIDFTLTFAVVVFDGTQSIARCLEDLNEAVCSTNAPGFVVVSNPNEATGS
jgi:diguanylate cyclase (GGDEF)-like protein